MKKTETFVEKACREVAGFSDVYAKLEQRLSFPVKAKVHLSIMVANWRTCVYTSMLCLKK